VISVKLTNGTRVQSKFNTTHTVADVRRFIEYEMIQAGGFGGDMNVMLPPFELVSGFPPQPIEEGTEEADMKSLDAAKLLNAAISQRMKPQQAAGEGRPKAE
jgi:hypothetical protein